MDNYYVIPGESAEYEIPSYLIPILKGKYWYTVNEFIQMIKDDRQIFNLKKFDKARKDAYNCSIQTNSHSKWKYVSDCVSKHDQANISYITLKILYKKCLFAINELRSKARKNKINLSRLIQVAQLEIEKFIYNNNVKFLYPKNEKLLLVISLKEIFNEKSTLDKPLSNLSSTFKQLVVTSFNEPTIQSSLRPAISEIDEEEKIEDKKNRMIEQVIRKDNSLNFVFGGFSNYFLKNTILLEENSKLLEGKMLKIYCVDSKVKTGNSVQCDLNSESLGDLLGKNNSYFFPKDNKKFRKKMFNKLTKNAINSKTLGKEISLEQSTSRFNQSNFSVNSELYNNESKSKIINIRGEAVKTGATKKIVLSCFNQNDNKMKTNLYNSSTINSSKCLNTISNNYKLSKELRIRSTKKSKYTFFGSCSSSKRINKEEINSNILPSHNNKCENLFDLFKISENSTKFFSTKERIIQDMKIHNLKNEDGYDRVKQKFIKLSKSYNSLTKWEKSERLSEIELALNSIKMKREFADQSHKKMISLIKRGTNK